MQNKRLIFAHRGIMQDGFPENSFGAFRKCVESGMGIELDVRLTKDGVPVVFHDRTLKRMCGDARRVSELRFEQLSGLRLLGTDEGIPALQEVLELVNGRTELLIELKLPKRHIWHRRLERKVIPLLKNYKGAYMLQSFNRHSMRYVKRRLPQIRCGILSGDCYAEPKKFDFINYRMKSLDRAKVMALKRRYPIVMGWISGKMTSGEALEKMNTLMLDGAVI